MRMRKSMTNGRKNSGLESSNALAENCLRTNFAKSTQANMQSASMQYQNRTCTGAYKRSIEHKEISKQIKPFNFVLVGQAAESGTDGEPIHPITKIHQET